MRLRFLTRLLAGPVGLIGLVLAVCPSLSYGQEQIKITPAIPQTGGSVTFQVPSNCGGFWLILGSGALGGQGGHAGNTFSVSIGDGAAGAYQVTLDSGVGSACPYLVEGFVVTQPGLSLLTGLSGQYTFLCRGRLPASQGGGMTAAVGSFVADGAGKLSGILDYNSPAKTLLAQPTTGTYSLDSTGSGQLTLKTPIGTPQYAVFVNPAEIAAGFRAYSAAMVQQDAGGENSRCSVSYVTTYALAEYRGGQLLQLSGEADCSGACPGSQGFAGNAILSLNGDQTASSVNNLAGAAFTIKNLELTGGYTSDTTTGRLTVQLSTPGESSSIPKHFVAYPADEFGVSLYLLSIDPHSSFDLLIGKAPHRGDLAF